MNENNMKEKKKTVLSTIAVVLLIIYYVLGIIAIICENVGTKIISSKENIELGQFVFFTLWMNLARLLALFIPLLCGLPNLILCIVGWIKEKRALPFLLCVTLPLFMWFYIFCLLGKGV